MKEVMDNVHGFIQVPDLALRFINTPTFKRLKMLKQLGNSHEVYPTGNHSRFEHSIGTMHLCDVLCEKLRKSGANITDVDKLCVQLAGLCHDLGHGPYSHLWEQFIRARNHGQLEWEHERTSIDMIDLIIEEDNICLEDYGLGDKDLIFIKEMIFGPLDGLTNGYPYQGRSEDKYYLYEIVSNKISGVDLDKLDYLLRDSKATGVQITYNDAKLNRLLNNMKVVQWKSPEFGVTISRIAARDKTLQDYQEIFLDRSSLHNKVYQHEMVKKMDKMLVDALIAADDFYPKIRGSDGEEYKLSEAWRDVTAFRQLSDDVVTMTILNSVDPNLEESKKILTRIQKRQVYQVLKHVEGDINISQKAEVYEKELQEMTGEPAVCVSKRYIDMGKNKRNPVLNCLFFNKNGKLYEPSERELEAMAPKKLVTESLLILLRCPLSEITDPEGLMEKIEEFINSITPVN